MIRDNEFLVLLRGKNFKKFKNKEIIFRSSGRVPVLVRFDPKFYGFLGFDLFRVLVEKIMFKTQNFQVVLGRVFVSGRSG